MMVVRVDTWKGRTKRKKEKLIKDARQEMAPVETENEASFYDAILI